MTSKAGHAASARSYGRKRSRPAPCPFRKVFGER